MVPRCFDTQIRPANRGIISVERSTKGRPIATAAAPLQAPRCRPRRWRDCQAGLRPSRGTPAPCRQSSNSRMPHDLGSSVRNASMVIAHCRGRAVVSADEIGRRRNRSDCRRARRGTARQRSRSRLATMVPPVPSNSGSSTRSIRERQRDRATWAVDLLRQPMAVDQRAIDAGLEQQVEPVVEQRLAVDRHEAFRNGIGERSQPGAEAGGEQQRFHGRRRPSSGGSSRRVQLADDIVELERRVADAADLAGRRDRAEIDAAPDVQAGAERHGARREQAVAGAGDITGRGVERRQRSVM